MARGRRRTHANVQFAQLRLGDSGGRIGQRIGGGLCLRKGDDLANTLDAAHEHRQPIQPEGDTAVRWATITQGIQQEAEFEPRLLGADSEQPEHGRLHFLAENTDRAAADFRPVEHEVIGTRQRLPRRGRQRRRIIALWRGERMMRRLPALGARIPFEHRKIDDP